jgi:hypothetical protein
VAPTKKPSRRKPGRPRKYGQGRINATVRFTPERYAELRAEADQQGRSLSEQVEYIVEQRKIVASIGTAVGTGTASGVITAIQEERLAEVVEAAVARALKREDK